VLTSLKSLLTSIVDYAGLFPPAQLSLVEAVATYDRAQRSSQSWICDRFVIPAPHLDELSQLLSSASERMYAAQPWSLSVILSQHWVTELEAIQHVYNPVSQPFCPLRIRALEVAPLPPSEIQQVCLHLPDGVEVFFEIPFDRDLEPYLNVLQQTQTAAKLRTGGITPNAFPDRMQLSQRILSLARAQIPFKATAGLHHALCGNYRLTDEPDSAFTTMPGFLNLAILAALAHQQSMTQAEAIAILEQRSIASFQFTDTAISWGDYSLSLLDIAQSRQRGFRSFGSCSLQEPIADLHHLGFL
jgi:hypothetical protein